jgi:hypothetical protein
MNKTTLGGPHADTMTSVVFVSVSYSMPIASMSEGNGTTAAGRTIVVSGGPQLPGNVHRA